MRRIKTFVLVLLGGFIGAGFCAAASAADPFDCAPSFAKASPYAKPLQRDKSEGRPGAMISSTRVPFVANEGQIANPDVQYYARTFGGTVYALADGKIVYSLPKYGAGKTAGSAVITESLRGAFQPELSGAGKSRIAVNSFIGNRPEKWKTGLPAFDRLDFGEVYEGISLLLSARGNNVEKIFVLSPGADPREIAFGFEGVSGVEIMPDGKLELQTALGAVYFTRPVAWQIDAGGKSLPVIADYALDEDGTVRFELSSYDPNKILVIDPFMSSTFIGGSGADAVQALVVDSQTNVYVAGYTDSSDFPTTNTPYSSAPAGFQDAFVSKFDASLGALSASTYIGGSSNDQATAIGIDAGSRIWLAGYTESTNFPCGASSMNSNYNGNGDAFVAVLSANLGAPFQATYLGGSNLDRATAITMNNFSSNQYVVGYTESDNFPVTNSTGYRTNYNGNGDAFVVLFTNSVSRDGYKTGIFLGGTNADEAAAVMLTPGTSPTNFVFVAGFTSSTNFPGSNGYQKLYGGGSNDAFVSRLSALLTNLPSSTFLGGTGSDIACAIGLGISNRVYVAGYTAGATNFPRTPSNNVYLTGWTNASCGIQNIFVSCLTNNLTNLYKSTYIGGTNSSAAKCLVVDSDTNRTYVYLAGYTTSTNFPTTRAAYDRSYNGGEDAFILRMDGPLTNMYASTFLGGSNDDRALAIVLSPDSNTLFVAGRTASSNDFPSSDAAYQNVFCGGTNDGFVTKFPASLSYGTVKWKKFIESDLDGCSSPAMTWDGTVVIGITNALCGFTRSGIERWRVETTSSITLASREGLGVPSVGTNDVIYISTSSGKVHAISFTGAVASVAWTFNCGAVPAAWSAVTIGSNGGLFFAQHVKFYAISQTNTGLWTNSLPISSFSAPAVDSNGTIYAASGGNPMSLYAFNPTNGETNHVWITNGAMYSSPAVDTNGTIYAASSNQLCAFNSDGTTGQIWTAAADILSSPAIGTNGVIYIGGGSNLYAFNPTSTQIWNVGSAGGEIKSSPAIAADGSIIVGADNGFVYSFNPDGTTNWTCATDDFMRYEAPFVDSEGTIYITDLRSVYAIYGSAPPADSAWPMFRHDALRTGNQGMNVANFLKPTGLTANGIGSPYNYIRVSWNASANAISYELWRSTNDSTAAATRIRRLTQTNYNDSSVNFGQVYYYWVKVKTPVALSAFSDPNLSSLPPSPPEHVTASKGIPTNYVNVTWYASSNATIYYVYHSLINATNTAVEIGSTTITNYDDHTIAPGLTNYYWVKAANAEASESGFSSNDYGGIPCWPPSGWTASQGAYTNSVVLNWNSSTGANSYVVFRNTENNSDLASIITDTSASPTNDSSGTPMRQYYYWLKTTNRFGLSAFTASALGWSLLAPPRPVSASAGAYPNMIQVSWIAGSTDATAHVIFRSLSFDSSTAVKQSEVVCNYPGDPTATNYYDTAITRGFSYYYWVAAKNNYGSSTWTAASAPGGTIPATPADLNASDGTDSNMVQVTWTTSPGSIYYTVWRHTTFDPSFATQIGSSSTNHYDDVSAVHGVLYYYWVKAGNNCGISDLSTFNSGWRGLTPPDNVRASDGSSTSAVTVSWSAAPDAAFYELWRGTSGNAVSANRLANNIAAVSVPSYNDQAANPGTVYYYWVKTKRGAYSSALSSSDSGYMAIGLLDIGVSDFVFVPTVFGSPAHPSAVSFNIANLSGSDMSDPNNMLQYDLYLSTNAAFGGGDDYWIGGTNSTLTLRAGASARVTFPQAVREIISIPDWATGSYYVFVFVNHCLPSAWLDPNLANNSSRRVGDSVSISTATALQPVWNDFDGDGKSDLAVYNGSTGSLQAGGWKTWLSASDYAQVDLTLFGGAGYRAVPRDYDGDGKVDLAVYNEGNGGWRIGLSGSGYQTVLAVGWGGVGQYPVPADYDGDGRVDPAVYQAGVWRGWMSGSGYAEVNVSGMGGFGWWPAPADYDGDGHADPAVYHEGSGAWRVWLSGSGYQEAYVINWGGSGQRPVPADYDADGKSDPAVYHEASGTWRVWLSSSGYQENSASGWGGDGQTAVPGDYDGDGRVDLVIYWESMGIWRLWLSSYGYSELDILMSGGVDFHAITFWE